MTRRPFLVAACLTTVLVAAQALTTTPVQAQRANAAEAMALRHNADAQGLALKGYDPVAYFTLGQPTPGLRTITAVHAGVTYQFATDAHRTAFEAAPERYLPAYGGYCAMGMVGGRFFDIDPAAWRIEALSYPARRARHSISTRAPSGSPATATVVRAGYGALKRSA